SACRRATAETTAPATSVSSMMRAFSSPENRRRRPVPVITSRRCTPSGLSVWSNVDTSRSPIQRSSHSLIANVWGRWDHHNAYAATLVNEALYKDFRNRREVAGYFGLAPSPWQSGGTDREQGISKAGNPRAREKAIELAWLWLRHQPDSALTQWF